MDGWIQHALDKHVRRAAVTPARGLLLSVRVWDEMSLV